MLQTSGDYQYKKGKITIIPQLLVEQMWPKVLPLLEKAREYWQGYFTLDDIKVSVLAGSMQMWTAIEKDKVYMVGLTSLEPYPACLVLRILLIGGSDVRRILPCISEIENWGAMLGAQKCEIIGRDAWWTLMKPYGYVKRSIVLTKDIVSMISDRRH